MSGIKREFVIQLFIYCWKYCIWYVYTSLLTLVTDNVDNISTTDVDVKMTNSVPKNGNDLNFEDLMQSINLCFQHSDSISVSSIITQVDRNAPPPIPPPVVGSLHIIKSISTRLCLTLILFSTFFSACTQRFSRHRRGEPSDGPETLAPYVYAEDDVLLQPQGYTTATRRHGWHHHDDFFQRCGQSGPAFSSKVRTEECVSLLFSSG